MKRPWLITGLVIAISGMSVIGIRHFATITVDRGITRFKASLPPGTTLTYAKARPAILSRGAILTHVVLKTGTFSLQAPTLKLGHPVETPDGGFSIAHLDMSHPTLQTANLIATADTVSLSDLVTPPPLPEKTGIDGLDLSHLHLSRGHVTSLTLTPSPHSPSTTSNMLSVGNIRIENYGPGLSTTIQIDKMLCNLNPAAQTSSPIHLALNKLQITQPQLANQLIKLRDPTFTKTSIITPAADLALNNLQLMVANQTFQLDSLTETGTPSAQSSKIQATAKGFHYRSLNHHLPIHIDGQNTRLTYTVIYNTLSGENETQNTLTIPDLAEVHLNTSLIVSRPNAPRGDASIPPADSMVSYSDILNRYKLSQFTLTFQGDKLLHSLPDLMTNRKLSAAERTDIYNRIVQQAQQYAAIVPNYAAVADYVASPNNRTLSLTFHPQNPLSLNDAMKLSNPAIAASFFGPDNLKTAVQ